MQGSATTGTYSAYRLEWLALREEEVLAANLPIIDAHHHLWDEPRPRYMPDDYIGDIRSGHNIIATIYVECRSMYRASGPEHLKAVGEVEFANGVAAMGASGQYGDTRLAAAIVSHVDLRGPQVRESLEAMIAAGGGRFRGIRQISAWDPDLQVAPIATIPPRLLNDPDFREGFRVLADLGLSFDAYLYHHQLMDIAELAEAFPDTTLIIDHLGGPIGIGRFQDKRTEVFKDWRAQIMRVSSYPNVHIKISGLGMRMFGFGFEECAVPPSSEQIAASWLPYVETCIEAFGCDRAMFASNFPPDKGSCSYRTLWNAYKLICADYSKDENEALFSRTAAEVYRIKL